MKQLFIIFVLTLLSAHSIAQSNKPIVAVGEFESSFNNFDTRNIKTALETALSQTGKFTLMERGRLDQLLSEQNLSMSGIVGGASNLGGFSGVDYLIMGRVTALGLESKNLLIMSECKAKFGLDVKVVDVRTGEIRLTDTITESDGVNTSDAESNPCQGIGITAFDTLTASASRAVAASLTQVLFPVKVANSSNGQVYLNYGSNFLQQNEVLKIVALGEGFEDPDTGEMLGQEEELIALVQIFELKPKFSKAKIIYEKAPVSKGDVANRLSKKEQKNVSKFVKKCGKSKRNEAKRCTKSGKKCDKARESAIKACTL